MIIDVFNADSPFEHLKQYNELVIRAWDKVTQLDGARYVYRSDPTKEVSSWFNPHNVSKLPFTKHYPKLIPLNHDPKFSLLDNRPNYVSIFLINALYRDRKDVVIEDVCCGSGRFTFYLSKLGFSNFSLFDDFSQMLPELLTSLVDGIGYELNGSVKVVRPVVSNQVAYPYIVRDYTDSLELVCIYNNENLLDGIISHLAEAGDYRLLCSDRDDLMSCFVRGDKFDEFYDIIKKSKPIEKVYIVRRLES